MDSRHVQSVDFGGSTAWQKEPRRKTDADLQFLVPHERPLADPRHAVCVGKTKAGRDHLVVTSGMNAMLDVFGRKRDLLASRLANSSSYLSVVKALDRIHGRPMCIHLFVRLADVIEPYYAAIRRRQHEDYFSSPNDQAKTRALIYLRSMIYVRLLA